MPLPLERTLMNKWGISYPTARDLVSLARQNISGGSKPPYGNDDYNQGWSKDLWNECMRLYHHQNHEDESSNSAYSCTSRTVSCTDISSTSESAAISASTLDSAGTGTAVDYVRELPPPLPLSQRLKQTQSYLLSRSESSASSCDDSIALPPAAVAATPALGPRPDSSSAGLVDDGIGAVVEDDDSEPDQEDSLPQQHENAVPHAAAAALRILPANSMGSMPALSVMSSLRSSMHSIATMSLSTTSHHQRRGIHRTGSSNSTSTRSRSLHSGSVASQRQSSREESCSTLQHANFERKPVQWHRSNESSMGLLSFGEQLGDLDELDDNTEHDNNNIIDMQQQDSCEMLLLMIDDRAESTPPRPNKPLISEDVTVTRSPPAFVDFSTSSANDDLFGASSAPGTSDIRQQQQQQNSSTTSANSTPSLSLDAFYHKISLDGFFTVPRNSVSKLAPPKRPVRRRSLDHGESSKQPAAFAEASSPPRVPRPIALGPRGRRYSNECDYQSSCFASSPSTFPATITWERNQADTSPAAANTTTTAARSEKYRKWCALTRQLSKNGAKHFSAENEEATTTQGRRSSSSSNTSSSSFTCPAMPARRPSHGKDEKGNGRPEPSRPSTSFSTPRRPARQLSNNFKPAHVATETTTEPQSIVMSWKRNASFRDNHARVASPVRAKIVHSRRHSSGAPSMPRRSFDDGCASDNASSITMNGMLQVQDGCQTHIPLTSAQGPDSGIGDEQETKSSQLHDCASETSSAASDLPKRPIRRRSIDIAKNLPKKKSSHLHQPSPRSPAPQSRGHASAARPRD